MKQDLTVLFFKLFTLAIFCLLFGRLFWLQVVKLEYYSQLSEENRVRIKKIPPLRGVIYDRNKEVLVRNRPEGRDYIYGSLLAHVSGYVGEADEQEIKEKGFSLSDIIGKTGIERQYDSLLRGKDGGVLIETGSQGETLREISRLEPVSGTDLILNINLGLQKKAAGLLEAKKGAIVAANPKGEILVLASSPSFDPNLFSQDKPGLENILNDQDQPLFNRAISGLYPPGSTFKIVTGIAGLEEGKLTALTKVEDTGVLKVGRWSFGNWYYLQYGKTEGEVDILKAFQRSNDIYFYKAGEWLGINKLAEWAHYFNFGRLTAIDLPSETEGLVPTPEWKEEVKGESWYLGDSFITAIGQGNLLVTPLQVNVMTTIIANNGWLCQPQLLKSDDENCQQLAIKKENLKLVQEGMKRACDTGGTGWPFFDFKVEKEGKKERVYVGCKTGTAEYGDPKNRTHAWFTVYAPHEKPEIIVTVLVEEAGEGSYQAAPLAKELLTDYFALTAKAD